ncbi:MAG: cytochrome c family protein [Proteobacteria bacterium]|nr:cytochrome c family protein [Pseudomonadota bacterium]
MRFMLAAIAALALAACGQSAPSGSTETPNTTNESSSAPAAPSADDAQSQAAVAALPAPYNAANYQAGRTVFAQCRSCHTITNGGANMVGPNLHGVIDRPIASLQNFNYSPPVHGAHFNWDPEHLDQWISNPQAMLPGTRMGFAGVRDATQRRDVIAYIMVESTR